MQDSDVKCQGAAYARGTGAMQGRGPRVPTVQRGSRRNQLQLAAGPEMKGQQSSIASRGGRANIRGVGRGGSKGQQ